MARKDGSGGESDEGGAREGSPNGAPLSNLSPGSSCGCTAIAMAALALFFIVDVFEALALRPGTGEQRVLRFDHLKNLLAPINALKSSFHPQSTSFSLDHALLSLIAMHQNPISARIHGFPSTNEIN